MAKALTVSKMPAEAEPEAVEPETVFDDWPCIEPGEYVAYCRAAKVYRDPGFKRWTCKLTFDVLGPDGVEVLAKRIPLWLNLGMGEKPRVGRRGRYFQEWIKANGGPPKRGDRMSPRTFTHRMVRLEIGDTVGAVPYSVGRQILSWETGEVSPSLSSSLLSLSSSLYQDHPSTSTIKGGTPEEARLQKLRENACQKFARSRADASALAGVEGHTPTQSQGRAAVDRCPQRHPITIAGLEAARAMPSQLSDADIQARRAVMARQAGELLRSAQHGERTE